MRNIFILIALLTLGHVNAQNEGAAAIVNQSEFIKLNLANFDLYVNEVFKDEMSYIHQNDSRYYNRLRELMQNRMYITFFPYHETEKYENTLNVPMYNNSQLPYDYEFDLNTFNPFKYDFDFYPRLTKFYRIAHTNYALIINPINQ